MPYIKPDLRERAVHHPMTAGELNYAITRMVDAYVGWYGGGKPCYDAINEAIGALECAKLELYRRIAAPYEDTKCVANGDVYEVKA